MRFEDLSSEDQNLVNTDFGGLDKVAAEQVKVASEMYNAGAEMAASTADQMDKLAAESEKEEEEKEEHMGEEEKKASADYGNIIAEGFIDKLAELGEERYGNPSHYVMPYVREKVAQVGAQAALEKFAKAEANWLARMGTKSKSAVKGAYGKTYDAAAAAASKQKERHSEGAKRLWSGVKGKHEHVSGKMEGKERMRRIGEGAKKMAPGLAAGGAAAIGGGLAARHLMKAKKEESAQ